jgi:hypothetical protein
MDESEALTAWHEAGHAVIGFALGGRVESVSLGGEANEWLPERFGDCVVNWGPVDATCNWQIQREIMTLLAGPVAEMMYLEEVRRLATVPEWQYDWEMAFRIAESFLPNADNRTVWLERLAEELHLRMERDSCRAAIAAVADELLAHEILEEDQLQATIGFWLRRDA